MSKRIYTLASELGVTNKRLIEFLWMHGIDAKNHLSIINGEIEKLVVKEFKDNNYRIIETFNSSSLKFIEIKGLFEEYNYKINLNENINIFVAENGFGKTTILNIIVSLLKNDRTKLKSLPFKSIKIGIGNKSIDIEKSELINNIDYRDILDQLRKYIPIRDYKVFLKDYKENGSFDLEEALIRVRDYIPNSLLYSILEKEGQDIDNKKVRALNKKLKQVQDLLKEEIVYFPTYRRIEENFTGLNGLSYGERMSLESELKKNSMNFGMDDVEKIIKSITDKIKKNSIDDYSKMSGQILDELLSDSVDLSDLTRYKIDKDKIKIVIGRIGSSNIKHIDKLNEFIEKNELTENERFTAYFVYRLALIYESQRVLDDKIKKFVEVSNKYLVNKRIHYNEVLAEVKILSNENKYPLKFNQLSSGEKQIISLFAKLYLDISDSVIFIIDEPELSLSIVWQETLLEDIYESGKISLLIATTHSPFIFRNRFSTYARELRDCQFKYNRNEVVI